MISSPPRLPSASTTTLGSVLLVREDRHAFVNYVTSRILSGSTISSRSIEVTDHRAFTVSTPTKRLRRSRTDK